MELGPEALAFAQAVTTAVLGLNFFGIAVVVLNWYLFGIAERELLASAESVRVWSPLLSKTVAVGKGDLKSALARSLAIALPFCEVVSNEPDQLTLYNRGIVGRRLRAMQAPPLFRCALIELAGAGGDGTAVVVRADYSRFAAFMRRALWIAFLLLTLPNLAGTAPLDFYVRRWHPEWNGYRQLGYLFHFFWPILLYFLYRMNLRTARLEVSEALRSAVRRVRDAD